MKYILRFCFVTFLLTMVGCHGKSEVNDSREIAVRTMEVNSGQINSQHEYVGTLEESSSTKLCFSIGGRVTAVYVKDGQRVAKGQLLATIDNRTALNSYNAAKATLERAQDGYDRAKLVHDRGSLPDVKWIEVQTQLNQAKSMEEIARKNLEDCELRAPVSGMTSDKDMEVGSTVSPLVPVVRIVGMDGMYVKVSIPEVDINKVSEGTHAQVMVNALGDTVFDGVVEERNVSADALSHSYMVRIRLKGMPKGLLPGMVCRVMLEGEHNVSAIELPSRAVQLDNEGNRYVWIVENGMAQKRTVTIADLTRNGVIISEGLEQGDIVIIDGTQKVASGSMVKSL